ncbi:NUDIX hydrolase [Shewanella intestini]|uniref:Phosphatase NudJ n=1 Tax=Shewanella intestini TaxID=2017544 RepID=A0ABS5I1D2_9GAMM|nr:MULTISPECIES: NUDIX hydrolase [Shewanella]MBR9727824.1 NUDIX hydrolase [Shewanella intestini]MRG36183.1 NUDIX domain-containing protein [Shewanella sp. XMDDZSB0408]
MQRYKPNTTVACVIHCDGHFLLVEELINNKPRFNQPAGHLEANETLVQACLREVKEETGLTVELSGLLKIYQFTATDNTAFIRFTFVAELTSMVKSTPIDPVIKHLHWLNLDQIKALNGQLRSPLVLNSINDYFNSARALLPLSTLDSRCF